MDLLTLHNDKGDFSTLQENETTKKDKGDFEPRQKRPIQRVLLKNETHLYLVLDREVPTKKQE